MPPISGMMHWHHYLPRIAKTVKNAISKAARTLDNQIGPQAKLEPVLVRNTPKQPTHPLARIRQSQSRLYSTTRRSVDRTVRTFTSSVSGRAGVKYDRASFPRSRTSASVAQSSGRAPFAHTLRPNLTGGALGRTAGGYTLGSGRVGGARYFSHGPACQAQVVQNVSQAVRAFFIGGQKAQFDGVSSRGEKRYKPASALQQETGSRMRDLPKATPGSYVDFRINPTVTALAPMTAIVGLEESSPLPNDHLNTDGLLDVLSTDFSRALKDLATTLNDLRRLSALGDLPITYEGQYLRIHFPGVDAAAVERLCEELNVTRGTVAQDESFDTFAGTEIALLFPFAPTSAAVSEQDDCGSFYEQPLHSKGHPAESSSLFSTSQSPAYSIQSAHSDSDQEEVMLEEDSWHSPDYGFQSVHSRSGSSEYKSGKNSPLEYQGFEGIYRFIEELDSVRRR